MFFFLSPKVAAGQIISRLQLSWQGRPTTSVAEAAGAFRRLFRLVCSYWCLRAIMFLLIASRDPSARFDFSQRGPRNYEEPPNSYYLFCAIDDLIWYGYFGFCVYLLKNIRYVKCFGRAIDRSINPSRRRTFLTSSKTHVLADHIFDQSTLYPKRRHAQLVTKTFVAP
jgi:hypothetical protein